MNFNQVSFLCGATTLNDFPKTNLPEVAFIGRSNAGKSSLINVILGHSGIAKTSKTPGRTQQINFFILQKLLIADLPGYGYTSAPVEVAAKWQKFNLLYLTTRKQLYTAFILVDSRVGFKDIDVDLIEHLNQAAVRCQVVYTKSDKLNKSELETLKKITNFNDRYEYLEKSAVIASSKTKEGVDKLRKIILAHIK